MPIKTIHEAKTEHIQVLNKDGRPDKNLVPDLSRDELLAMYRLMMQMRMYDTKALNLQRQGRIGTYGELHGQEAAQAGLVAALAPDDWIIPSFREHGVLMGMGMPMHLIYAYWKGDERGNIIPGNLNIFPGAVPVGSQLLHAVGVGWGLRMKEDSRIAVGFAGDGATSEGDFHEACNFAGVFKARTLIYIQNNQWAISVPFKKQTAGVSIAQRAHAYGFPGIQVDGNDVLGVYLAATRAVEHIRSGKGPYLIEALTYRMGNHTTADDQTKYRSSEDVEYWKARDPIDRMRKYLVKRKFWDEDSETALQAELNAWIEEEVKLLESMPAPDTDDMFDHMYQNLPWNIQAQKQQFQKEVRS